MILKIVVVFFLLWLFFKIFGRRILLYLVKRMVQKLEQQTLKDMKHFQNLYDEKAKHSYPLNDDFFIIIPERLGSERNQRHAIEDIEFEDLPRNKRQDEGNLSY